MTANLYENTAALYDIGNDRSLVKEDMAFYLRTIPAHASVLEVGCGTGRVSIALAERGNLVTGLDLSHAMLDVFRRKMARGSLRAGGISLHCMDMRHFDLGRTFDWIIFPFRVFQALASDEDRRACLASVRRHMTRGSRAILTLFNPMKSILDGWGTQNILDFECVDEMTGRTIKRYQDQLWHDREKQVIATRMRYEVYEHGALLETLLEELELGYLYPDQCARLFAESRMDVVDAFGYYDGRPLTPGEQREQIYVLRRVASE